MNKATLEASELVQQFKAARRVSTPLIAITTPDPAATQELLCDAINGDNVTPKIAWDVVRGLHARNEDGVKAIAQLGGDELVQSTKANPVKALVVAGSFPGRTLFLFHNAHRFLDDVTVVQAIWNLRDQFKSNRRTLVLLGPSMTLPEELSTDVVEFDEPLPSEPQLSAIVREQFDAASDQIEFEVSDELVGETAIALKGTSAFAAEQLTAMSIRKDRLDRSYLDTQAKKLIEQTPGLTFERGHECFEDIGGLEFIKKFGRRLFSGPQRPAVVVRVEELEKSMSGAKGDLSGTSGDALQVILSSMEDYGWSGILAYGAPGAGKSLFAKSLANTHNAKALRFDPNATKGSLVGQSEQRIRGAMKVIRTIGGERVFFLASVNRLEALPPELQRRFKCGVWFFDLLDDDARGDVWAINRERFEIDPSDESPDESDLTGADIRNICEMAHALQCTLAEALQYVVPLKVQSPAAIREARELASGRFIDAAHGGVYRTPQERAAESRPGGKRVRRKVSV